MLVNFSVENWMSFKEPATVCMASGESNFLNERIPYIESHDMNLLPVAAIFGGNASGKSNLLNAIKFAQQFILTEPQNPDESISVNPFKLDTTSINLPTKFNFVLFVDNSVYDYSFAITHSSVVYEKLAKVNPKSEQTLYERKNGEKVEFSGHLKSIEFIRNVSEGVRSNQLFLTLIGRMDPIYPWPVYDWFKKNLVIVLPDSKNINGIYGGKRYKDAINAILPKLDCGINSIGIEKVATKLKNLGIIEIEEVLQEKDVTKTNGARKAPLKLTDPESELSFQKLVTFHLSEDNKLVEFDNHEESDGTLRILDLIPGLIDISKAESNMVYIIDEIDRSLHTNLCRNLLESYLENCSSTSRSQLLFTTHDILLMDKYMLRRDEMLITQRAKGGSTNISSLDEFESKNKKYELYKDYLNGRFGGVPDILLGGKDLNQNGASN